MCMPAINAQAFWRMNIKSELTYTMVVRQMNVSESLSVKFFTGLHLCIPPLLTFKTLLPIVLISYLKREIEFGFNSKLLNY